MRCRRSWRSDEPLANGLEWVLALFLEKSGLGPTDLASTTLLETGEVEVVTGAASLGQGVETVLAQICADAMGMDYRKIRVVHGTTNRIRKGFGSHASRTTVMTGAATHNAALALKARILDAVEGRYDLPVEVLEIRDGIVVRTDVGGEPVVTWPSLRASKSSTRRVSSPADHMTYPYGAHLAVVAVDRDTEVSRCVDTWLRMTSAGRSIQCWSRDRSREVSPKASAALCTRNSCTTNPVSRCPARSPTT